MHVLALHVLTQHATAVQQLFIGHCKKQEGTPGERELKIGQLNQKLDELVAAKGDEKVNVLRWLITHTSPSMMRWIICIILKDLKVKLERLFPWNIHSLPNTQHPT